MKLLLSKSAFDLTLLQPKSEKRDHITVHN